ncbi:MAG: hypothetical protein AAGF31_07930 [Planctomycetota bacterium]
MAKSPFDIFRKNTGLMMVILCALLMFAFVVADPLMQMAGSGRGSFVNANETAVSWDGGEMTEQELAQLVGRRQVLAAFLEQVLRIGYQTALLEGAVDPRPIVQPLSLPSTPEQGVEQDVVITKIYADAARDAGIVVSDETISQYLTDLGFGKVSKEQMRAMLRDMGGGQRGLTINYVIELLRDAMLARNYDRSYFYTSSTTMPQQRWEDWLRVNDRVIVEAAALRATDFLSQVEEPTDAELAAFYEEYKDAIPSPVRVDNVELPNPNPAFATPRRVVLQYAKLPLEQEADRLIDTVTEEEIAKFYEENKERYIRTDDLSSSDGLEAAPADTDETSSEEEEDSDASNAETTDDADAAEENEPASEGEAGDAPEADESSSLEPRSPFRLAAYQPADETAESSDSGEGATDSESADASDDSSAEDSLFGSDEAAVGDDASAGDASDSSDTDAPADSGEEEPVAYQTLDEVREEIRQTLAEAKVIDQLPARMEEIVAPLKRAYDDYFIKVIDAEDKAEQSGEEVELPEPPAELLELEKLAEANDLEFAETADLTVFEMRESGIGATRDFTRSVPQTGEPMPLWGRVFGDSGIELYEPVLTYDVTFDRNRNAFPINGYIVIKTEDKPRNTPTLDEIKPDVVRAWKLNKAADLALARAEEIAKEASGEGLALKDFLAGKESIQVDETDPFSYLASGQYSPTARRIPLRLSQPEPIEAPGPDFMKTVFELKPNEIGAVLNHDRSVAYVVRLVQHMASRSELRSDFLSIGDIQYGLYGFDQRYIREATGARVRELLGGEEGEPALDWKRTPDELVQTAS